jgi:hypothetical protein
MLFKGLEKLAAGIASEGKPMLRFRMVFRCAYDNTISSRRVLLKEN